MPAQPFATCPSLLVLAMPLGMAARIAPETWVSG